MNRRTGCASARCVFAIKGSMTTSNTRKMQPCLSGLRGALCACILVSGATAANAGLLDKIFGQNQTQVTKPRAGQRSWSIGEFSRIELAAREPGSVENQHPVNVQPGALQEQLARIQINGRDGPQSLFGAEELSDLIGPLAQALAAAGPNDDVLLLSSSRRGASILVPPTAVTARLFAMGGSLQFIAHDARYDFYDTYRGTHAEPRFKFGSRTVTGAAALQSPGTSMTSKRADWLSISLEAATAKAAAPAGVQPQPAPSVAAPAPLPAAPAAMPQAPPAVAAPAPARKALDPATAEDIEMRLKTLKRLRDSGLITEDEFLQKRKEILQLL
jgi:Short C-terminal domain